MEHFLPLAIASMVISLISIILLDHFGPSTSIKLEDKTLSDAENALEDQSLVAEKVEAETNMGITASPTNPIKTADSIDKNIKKPSINSFIWKSVGAFINNAYLQIGR